MSEGLARLFPTRALRPLAGAMSFGDPWLELHFHYLIGKEKAWRIGHPLR